MPALEHPAESSLDHLRPVLPAGHIGIRQPDLETGTVCRNFRHDAIIRYYHILSQWTS